MKKIIHIVGTRPNYIKLFPTYLALKNHFDNIIVDTNQHYDDNMSKVFFEELNLPPAKYNLNIGSGTHGYQTGELIKLIESLLIKENPDSVIVYGDVNSSLSGAIASVKLGIPILHVEAGARSFDRDMPEEINRMLIDQMSTINFCAQKTHVSNLIKENIFNGNLVGNVMADAVHLLKNHLKNPLGFKYYLCTLHRPFNVDYPNRLHKILANLETWSHKVIFPTHPRVKNKLTKNYTNIIFTEPLGYANMLSHIKHSEGVISDSGGVQCETTILKTPLQTVRPSTEHTVTLGMNNKLVSTSSQKIFETISQFLKTN
jgi:UDP-N-acetylglucosamine 2-epimerase